MAERFTYFGFEYEVLEGKKNEVALIDASSAHGRTIIPKEVEYNGQKYAVTQITGKKIHISYLQEQADKRKKPIRYYDDIVRGAFANKRHDGESHWYGWYRNYNPLDVVIPNSVNRIGSDAFSGCSGLTSVSIPNSVNEIGGGAFEHCSGLTSVTIPNSVTKIGWSAFLDCSGLTSVTIPNSDTSIEEYAFEGCSGLTSVTIPSSVKTIDKNTFHGSGIKTVKIENEEGAVIIHPYAFPASAKIEYVGKPKTKSSTQKKEDAKSATAVTIDLEKLIQAALVDGVVTDKERSILIKKVKEAGGDVDEFEMLLDARIFEATKKTAQAETPKAAPKPVKTEAKAEPAKAAPKSAKAEAPKPAATPATSAKGGLTVGSLTEAFKKQFGAVLRIYNGRSKADDGMSLQEVGLTQEINTTFDGKQTVGAFVEQMANAGLKVKVYTCDEWVAVLDGLTLEQAGKVKKNATKADMEKML